jgi:hypothetical protein
VLNVRVFVDVIHTLGVEGGGAALDAVHFIAFGQKELGKVAAVLAGDAGDESSFHERGRPLLAEMEGNALA